eukprot:GABV01004303.1.p1 GENE.GABV01004303.1~~GABV01004303.1.p1  ORF type:complete len:138 (+),score=44.46 GABV01004303.1:57-470(+)
MSSSNASSSMATSESTSPEPPPLIPPSVAVPRARSVEFTREEMKERMADLKKEEMTLKHLAHIFTQEIHRVKQERNVLTAKQQNLINNGGVEPETVTAEPDRTVAEVEEDLFNILRAHLDGAAMQTDHKHRRRRRKK